MITAAPPKGSHRLARASILVAALSWLPMAVVIVEDYFDSPPSGEVQGMAAIGAAFGALVILGGGALVGTVLACIALRRPPRPRAAWTGLLLNLAPLASVVALAIWPLFSR